MGFLTILISSETQKKIVQASVQLQESKTLNPLKFKCSDCSKAHFVKISFEVQPAPQAPAEHDYSRKTQSVTLSDELTLEEESEETHVPSEETVIDPLCLYMPDSGSIQLHTTPPEILSKRPAVKKMAPKNLPKTSQTRKEDLTTRKSPKFFKCRRCPAKFSIPYYIKRHEKYSCINRPRPEVIERHRCPVCGAEFLNGQYLRMHLTHEHSGNLTKQCSVCEEVFDSPNEIVRHRTEKHNYYEWQCRYCPKLFNRKKTLVTHEFMHPDWTRRLDKIEEMFEEAGLLKELEKRAL